MRLTDFSSPSWRAWFHGRLLTLSGASLVQLTMRNPSGARSATPWAVRAGHRGDQFDSPAAEVLTVPATHAAALVMPAAPPSA